MLCRYVEGGMGSVSSAISTAAREAGAHIVTNAEVCFCKALVSILFFLAPFSNGKGIPYALNCDLKKLNIVVT